jgi:hypothetical protein
MGVGEEMKVRGVLLEDTAFERKYQGWLLAETSMFIISQDNIYE